MEKLNFQYSTKNIPIASKTTYKKSFIEKTENFLKRMRWKAFYFNNKSNPATENVEKYNFKSTNTPPQDSALKLFEYDMAKLIREIKFREIRTPFQNQLKNDVNKILN